MSKKDTATSGNQGQDPVVMSSAADASQEESTRLPKAEESQQAAEAKQPKQHEVNNSGFYMYIGPTIRGVIQNGALYRGTRAEALEAAKDAIEKYRLVKALIVSGDDLPVARLRLKQEGNAFYTNYRKLSRQVLEGRHDTARKNATPEEAAMLAAAEEKKEG